MRYFMLGSGSFRGFARGGPPVGVRRGYGGFGGGAGANVDLVTWVRSHCATVPASDCGSGSVSSFGPVGAQPLYDCGSNARTARPSS